MLFWVYAGECVFLLPIQWWFAQMLSCMAGWNVATVGMINNGFFRSMVNFRNLSYLSASGNCRRLFLGLRRSSPATITTSAPTPATAPVADSPRRRNSIASSTVGMPAQVSKFGENKPFTYRNVCFGGRNFRGPKQTFGHPRNVCFVLQNKPFSRADGNPVAARNVVKFLRKEKLDAGYPESHEDS